MPRFIVLARVREGRPEITSPEEAKRVTQRFIDWTNGLGAHLTGSLRLVDDEGQVLRPANGEIMVTDGPYLESKEFLGGYWLIEAASYDEALTLVKDHPSLHYGGSVELRRIAENH